MRGGNREALKRSKARIPITHNRFLRVGGNGDRLDVFINMSDNKDEHMPTGRWTGIVIESAQSADIPKAWTPKVEGRIGRLFKHKELWRLLGAGNGGDTWAQCAGAGSSVHTILYSIRPP